MNVYVQALKKIEPNEQKKHEFLCKAIQYRNALQSRSSVKQESRFTRKKKWIAAVASVASAFVFLAIFLPLAMPKYGGQAKTINDYYNEYSFALPFNHNVTNKTDNLYFDTTLTMEQMTEAINNTGYNAYLYNFDDVKRILITATENDSTYYCVIYDKSYLEIAEVYTLSNMSATIHGSNSDWPIYVFLFPHHFSGLYNGFENSRKMHCTFDEFAKFYKATGKSEVEIDELNKTVTFFCKGNSNANWISGNIIMRFVESESGNYVDIQPLSA